MKREGRREKKREVATYKRYTLVKTHEWSPCDLPIYVFFLMFDDIFESF
jgi:hypothetical protein